VVVQSVFFSLVRRLVDCAVYFLQSLDSQDYKDRAECMIDYLHDFYDQCGILRRVFKDHKQSMK